MVTYRRTERGEYKNREETWRRGEIRTDIEGQVEGIGEGRTLLMGTKQNLVINSDGGVLYLTCVSYVGRREQRTVMALTVVRIAAAAGEDVKPQ